jgi:hypothetical protein
LTACALTTALAVATGDGRLGDPASASPEPVVLNDKGAWSWFEDE